MTCPPSKRLRGLNQDAFDDDDFTQDDLDEIDTIASQAINSTAALCLGSKAGEQPHGSGFRSSTWPNKASAKGGHLGDPPGNRQQQFGPAGEDSYSRLEAQHVELKKKLKEVEEEIVLKNGEIRVLRDSLRGAQQEKESQRQNLVLLETQKQREQSDREKELNKKVQSLRSELQFKESEIMEMKNKLLSADRNKMASPLQRNSPKVLNGQHHRSGSSTSSPTGNGFITKEMFAAQVPTPVKTSGKTRTDTDRPASCGRSVDKREVAHPDPFQAVRAAYQQHRGGVLLGLLLQNPLSPSSLCLSHLLSMSPTDVCSLARRDVAEAPWDLRGRPSSSLHHNTSAASINGSRSGAPRAALSPVQSLAITGLNMLSQSRAGASVSSRQRRCPGAVLLLPLLDLHLSGLCQALDAPGVTSGTSEALRENRTPGVVPGRPDEAGYSLEDAGLLALRLLYLLLAHSDEVVQAVLSTQCESSTENKADSSAESEGPHSHNALLQSVLRLCRPGIGANISGGSNPQWEELVISALKTVRVLTERTPNTHADRLQCVLQVMCASVSADAKPPALMACVSVLVSLCDHASLTRQLCSQHEPCVILKLLQYVRNRPAKQTRHADLILLDLQVVRFLTRLTQSAEDWMNRQCSSSCQCYTELVQTVVIVLHRQWMDLQDLPELMDMSPDHRPRLDFRSPPWSLLRECMQLLHWLLHHHSGFSASCRPLLHMYDQVIPALRDTLRKIPELSESEELALEEICRPEGDDVDDMDTDFGS